MGDFNAIRFCHERQGGNMDWPSYMDDLNNCMLEAGLEDLWFGGLLYSWHNSRGLNHIRRKLDRALVNAAWLSSFELVAAESLPYGISDHSPVIVDLGLSFSTYRRPFKFFNFWAEFDEFLPLVEDVWKTNINGYAMFRVYKKLKLLKLALKELSLKKNKECSNALDTLCLELDSIQSSIAIHVGDMDSIEKERDCLQRLSHAYRSLESYNRQKSRVQWLAKGDKNSAFFFNSIKGRKNVNKIMGIQQEDGEWIKGKESIASAVVDFYKQLLGSECSTLYVGIDGLQDYMTHSLNDSHVGMLGDEFSDLEI